MATLRQKVLRLLYPLIRRSGRKGDKGTVLVNDKKIQPREPFFQHNLMLNDGRSIALSGLAGKKTLIVNTASDCGYTGQYAELQALHERMGDRLNIIAFPANDFGAQEQASDAGIASFCQLNYGVTFPIARKDVVIKKTGQQPVFRWLTDSSANGWCDHAPDWNFSKYIIDEHGVLTHYFGPAVSPGEQVLLDAVGG